MNEVESPQPSSSDDSGAVPTDLHPCLVPLYPAGPVVGIRFPLGESPYVVGADSSCDLHLPPEFKVAPRHARLDPGPAGPTVVALDGSVMVNDRAPAAPLRSGDCLRLGRCLIRYLAGPEGEERYREELYRLQAFDPWTGLHGRRYLLEFLQHELFATRRSRRPLSLAVLEMDAAAAVPPQDGALDLELAQRQLADCLRVSIRRADLIAVAGPRQLAVCLYKSRPEDAVHLTNRLRRLAANHVFRSESGDYRATISIGVATTRGEAPLSPEDLLAQAEAKLREAQAEGGDRSAC